MPTLEPSISAPAADSSGPALHVAVSGLALSRRPTGIGRYVRGLLTGYLERFPADRVTLALPTDAGDVATLTRHPNLRGETVPHALSRTLSRLRWELSALATWTQRVAPDVLFQPDFVLPPRRLPCPVAVTIHDLAFRKFEASKSLAMRAYLHRAVRRAVRSADRLIVHTRAVGEELVAIYGADPARIAVVEPPLEPVNPATDPQAETWLRELLGGRPYFLHLSNFDLRKNVDRLLHAFARHRRRGGPERLVLAGDGARRETLVEQARALGLGEDALFLGWTSDERREVLYRHARAFLFPSLFEGYGLPVVEAMARGLPVLTSRDPALVEAAGAAALLVEAEDDAAIAEGMERLSRDPELRASLAEAGRRRAERTSPRESAAKLREILQEITRQGRERC